MMDRIPVELNSERRRTSTELIHEGGYAAEVSVDLIFPSLLKAPTLSVDDAEKLERVRLALRRGDLTEAGKSAKLYELRYLAG